MDRDMRDRSNRTVEERDIRQPRAQQQAPRQNQEEEYALDELVNIVRIILTEESRPSRINSALRLVDYDKIMSFVEAIERQMPYEIPEARRIKEDKTNIIKNAQRKAKDICSDAENSAHLVMEEAQKNAQAILAEADAHASQILDEAQKKARAMVDQSEVRRIAEGEATKLIATARNKAAEAVRQSETYTDEVLSSLEKFISARLDDVQKSRAKVREKQQK